MTVSHFYTQKERIERESLDKILFIVAVCLRRALFPSSVGLGRVFRKSALFYSNTYLITFKKDFRYIVILHSAYDERF